MASSTWAIAVALALAALPAPARAADTAEPAPEALAQAWFDQLFGGNAIEYWTTDWAGGELDFAVARRWLAGRPEEFVHIFAPHEYAELNLLLREHRDGRLELLYYRTPRLFPADAKVARIMPASVPPPLDRLPFAAGLPAVSDVVPMRASDYAFTRLADTRVAGQPCRVIEGRPHATDLGFDRIRFSLAHETGVALESSWLVGEKLVRRIAIDPANVRDYEGRFLPTRRSVERPGNAAQVYTLRRLMLDPVLPDQLFTTQNLKLGRIPSY